MQPSELQLQCSDGLMLSALRWQNSPSTPDTATKRILCLHGWLDNAASFSEFAPSLATSLRSTNLKPTNEPHHQEQSVDIVALDLPGHGKSDHKAQSGPHLILAEYIYYVREALAELRWTIEKDDPQLILVGHSMGAAIATIFAASYPDLISQLVLLEGIGPMSRPWQDTAKIMRDAVEKRRRYNGLHYSKQAKSQPIKKKSHGSLEVAIDARIKAAASAPGQQSLSREAASTIVHRACQLGNDDIDLQEASLNDSSVYFRHDWRLHLPSLLYFTEQQVEGIYADLQCSVCLVTAQSGWPIPPDQREKVCRQLKIRARDDHILAGSHHFHADPETREAVVTKVSSFIQSIEGKR